MQTIILWVNVTNTTACSSTNHHVCELFLGLQSFLFFFSPVALGVFLGEFVVNGGGNTEEWTEMIEGKDKGR